MAEEQQGQEKTEEATPRKLEKSREDGQAARSRELNTVAIVTFGALALIIAAPDMAERLMNVTRLFFTEAGAIDTPIAKHLSGAMWSALYTFLPLGVVLYVAGLVSSVSLGGFVLSAKVLRFKGERLSLIKGFGRIFSVKSLMELAKSIAKFVLISGVAIGVLTALLGELMALGALPIETAIIAGVRYVGIAFLIIGCVLLLVAAIDVPFQIAQHKKQLKMTRQEVKDEMKNSEGKPEVKARIRQLQMQFSQRKMLDAVPDADVIITNPEHYSVAIRYKPGQTGAPVLLAKGVDHMALKIREVGLHHDVPLVAVPPLARAIYFSTDVEQEIPEGLYMAVAQVLAFIYQMEQHRQGTASKPSLADIQVPEEFEHAG